MGFNTAMMFCNDGIDQISAHPDQFAAGTVLDLRNDVEFGVGNHGGLVHRLKSEHADTTQVIAVGGNFMSRLFNGYGPHHTDEGKLRLLEQWADSLGYKVVPK